VIILTAAALAAVIFFLLLTLPPAAEHLPLTLDADLTRRTIPGAYHVHTTRSDGIADKATVAAAANQAGLKFAIFTDHGDGTRPPDVPAYIHGVLCIDGVEISTDDGHYVAIGMRPSPYPLGGAASAVVEDVARLGGFGIAAHPDSPKPSLRWRDQTAPVDGIEWLSADSEWRDESRATLVHALANYLVRPAAALASLLDRPSASLARWDAMTRERPVVALAAHDAHGGITGAVEDGDRAWVARVPSYEAAFRSMATRVLVDRPLTGHAPTDAALLLSAIRNGRVFTALDAVATPATLDFRFRSGEQELRVGESGAFRPSGIASARATVPDAGRLVLMRDGGEIASVDGGALDHRVEQAGVYRVEVHAPKAPGSPAVPWLVSNPVYLRDRLQPEVPPVRPVQVVRDLGGLAWRVEQDPASRATLSAGEGAARLSFELKAGERASQFAALVADLPPTSPSFDALLFTARASAPMRVSVQLRFGNGEARWGRSLYLDEQSRSITVRVADMQPAGSSRGPRPDPRGAAGLLFVTDLTNAAPGASGWFEVSRLVLGVLAN
jgi:hypothetical protein